MTTKTLKDIFQITLFGLVLNFLIWLPFLTKVNFYNLNFSAGFSTIYRNFDGLEYIVIAKSFYTPQIISTIPFSQTPIYYASHFPGFSILILLFAPLLGFLKSLLFISVLFTILSAIAFYFLIKDFKLTSHPLMLSLIFFLLPARWLIVHTVGSAEPAFIFFTILTFYFFLKFEQYKKIQYILLSSLMGLLAQLIRPPGILIFFALIIYVKYQSYLLYKKEGLKSAFFNLLSYWPLTVIPLGLLAVFVLFGLQYNDFWAYFHSGDNIHLSFPSYQVFNKNQFWVGEIWLEDIVYIFILGFLAALMLWKKKLYPLAFYLFTYLAASTLVVHRDISRYILPTFPFILISFQKILISKEIRIVLVVVALAIYLYTQNFILQNTAPVPNLEYYN